MMITTCLILWMPRGAASALGAASAASASMPAAAARHRPPRSNHHPAPLSSQLTDQTYTTRDRLSNTVSRFCYPRPMSPQAQRTRRREQRESTRRQILGAAERLLRERPFRELSVDAVMADTGLTRTAFYRLFDDVTELVLRLFAEVNQELFAVAQTWSEHAGVGYPAPGRTGLAGTVDFYVRHGPLLRAIAEASATDERIEE